MMLTSCANMFKSPKTTTDSEDTTLFKCRPNLEELKETSDLTKAETYHRWDCKVSVDF